MRVCVRDESPAGQSLHEMALEFLSERITVRELLRERVHHEVREFNRHEDMVVFNGLVQPDDTEQVLNGRRPEYRLKRHRVIDWESQFAHAERIRKEWLFRSDRRKASRVPRPGIRDRAGDERHLCQTCSAGWRLIDAGA